jgi:transcriptional regulator with XRE-family HTH domain
MATDRRTTHYDAHIGLRMRERRLLRGMSGHQLAGKIGVTAQQVFKYETGFSRATAGQLYQIACALKTPVTHFYEGLDEGHPAGARRQLLLELMRNFLEIPDEKYREALGSIVRTLAGR